MTYKIMLADDEPIMRKALQSLIDWERIDCEIVYVAENGQEVLNALTEIQPDILITDIKMPGADGIEISKYIKRYKNEYNKIISKLANKGYNVNDIKKILKKEGMSNEN